MVFSASSRLFDLNGEANSVSKKHNSVTMPMTLGDSITRSYGRHFRYTHGALQVAIDPFLLNRQDQLIALAARHALPESTRTVSSSSLGASPAMAIASWMATVRPAAIYTIWILKGEKPGDLPVMRHQVRADHQSEDRKGAGPRNSAKVPSACRRGRRMRAVICCSA